MIVSIIRPSASWRRTRPAYTIILVSVLSNIKDVVASRRRGTRRRRALCLWGRAGNRPASQYTEATASGTLVGTQRGSQRILTRIGACGYCRQGSGMLIPPKWPCSLIPQPTVLRADTATSYPSPACAVRQIRARSICS